MGVFRTRTRSLAVLLSSAVIVLTAACAGEGPAGPGDMGGAAKDREAVTSMPAIYVDSRLEFLIDDRNLVRDNYLLNRDVCRESGLPLRELSDEEVAKLGTGRLQRWYRSDRFAFRLEEWRFYAESRDQSGLCQFALSTSGAHHYVTPDTHQAMNLATGETFSEPQLYRDYFPRHPVDDANESEDLELQARNATRVPAKDRLVAGQPCEHFAVDRIDSCDWSGGKEWGFRTSNLGLLTNSVRSLFSFITLEQEPVGSDGMRLTTQTFQVGARFDESEMLPEAPP